MTEKIRSLILLSEHPELRVAGDDIDPTGWTLVDGEGEDCGTVVDLVVATDTMKVVYMLTAIAGERRVLLPATVARLDATHRFVIFDLLTPDLLGDLPGFVKLPLLDDEEARIVRAFTGREPIEPDMAASVDRRRSSRRSA